MLFIGRDPSRENPEKDVSVPINWAYNHHYMLWMTGNYSQMIEIPIDPTDLDDLYGGVNHGLTSKWIAVDLPSAKLRDNPEIPTSQLFSEGISIYIYIDVRIYIIYTKQICLKVTAENQENHFMVIQMVLLN